MSQDSLRNAMFAFCIMTVMYYTFFSYNILAASLAILALVLQRYLFSDSNLPPGPKGLPLVGILPWAIYYKPYVYLANLKDKYGPLIAASPNVIFINDYKMSKEMSQNEDFQGRPTGGFARKLTSGLGVVNAEGALWKHQRRFMVQSLKDSGMGKLHLQDKIQDELLRVFSELETHDGRPICIHSVMEKSTCNIICALAFNKQYEYDDPNFVQSIQKLDQNFRYIETLQMVPGFWWIPRVSKMMKTVYANREEFKLEALSFINDHKSSLDPDNPRDLIDLFLIEMSKKASDEESDGCQATFFEGQLVQMIVDLFVAGTETSSTTIRWAILYMIHHPEIQKKVQDELDEVVGTERFPKMEDKPNLPYTVATLQEIERLACVAPASLPRCNPKTANFHGYTFKPRCVFYFNIYAIHRDPEIWNNPESFNPSRYFDKDGKVFRPQELLPFGSGKRSCPGESLARMEIFLYFASMLQRFTFLAAEKDVLPSLDAGTGFVRCPKPYKVRAVKRNV